MEPLLTPYQAVSCIPAKHALVLAPHPDDEVFGCGGAVCAHLAEGARVSVVVMTSGEAAGDQTTRELETEQALKQIGDVKAEFWRQPDRGLLYSNELVNRLVGIIEAQGIDLLYAPSPWEVHPDHRHTCALAIGAANQAAHPVKVAFYEIGSPIRPNVLVNITPHVDHKQMAMGCYASQIERQDYIDQVNGLNVYRAYTLPNDIRAVEAFWVTDKPPYFPQALQHGLDAVTGAPMLQLPQANTPKPTVSVMLRSMGRDSLYQALDSLAVQTYRPLEVVVQAVRPNHPPVPNMWMGMEVRFLPTAQPLPRSQAANALLKAATGEYLLFLDDDDWLMPSHIERLADTLTRLPQHGACYTGVALYNEQNQPTGQVFDIPFDPLRQRVGNITPIHAVMFRQTLVSNGLAFDENFDLFEDWDFWLAVAQKTTFAHLPGVSAVYRIHESSGVHTREEETKQAADRIMHKWSELTDTDLASLRQRLWGYEDALKARAMAEEKANLADARASKSELAQQEATRYAAALRAELDKVYGSISWRITGPVRWTRRQLTKAFQLGLVGRKARRMRDILRTEGLRGLAYRLAQQRSNYPWVTKAYQQWITLYDNPPPPVHERVKFSVVIPVYNPPLALLREAIDSIKAQTYGNWEICMADDASPDPAVWEALQAMATEDARIKVTRRAENGHISKASNDALALATGDFVVLMDNDDILRRDALQWVAAAIAKQPKAGIVFSDEDKLKDGVRFAPYLKAGWNRALFMGQNLISHLGVYQRGLMLEVGGFRAGLEGSQDYDLALRCMERLSDEQIVHIPQVLYHWRVIEGSTALAVSEKPYAVLAAQRALNEHRQRTGKTGNVQISERWNYYTAWAPTEPLPTTSVAWFGKSETPMWLAAQGNNFAACNPIEASASALQAALDSCQSEVLLLVNSQILPVGAEAYRELILQLVNEDAAMVAGRINDESGNLIAGAFALNPVFGGSTIHQNLPANHPGYMGRADLLQEVSAIPLHCVAFHVKYLKQLAIDNNIPWGRALALALSRRVSKEGGKVLWAPRSVWQTANTAPFLDSAASIGPIKEAFGSNWKSFFTTDPYFHPSLDNVKADFSFRAKKP